MVDSKEKVGIMEKIAIVIVDKRKGFFLAYIVAAIFCVFSMNWVEVNEDITSYLPDTTETRQGLTIMEDEVMTYGMGEIMVDNISYSQAEVIAEELSNIEGVKEVKFDETIEHYKEAAAYYNITFSGEETDDISIEAISVIF